MPYYYYHGKYPPITAYINALPIHTLTTQKATSEDIFKLSDSTSGQFEEFRKNLPTSITDLLQSVNALPVMSREEPQIGEVWNVVSDTERHSGMVYIYAMNEGIVSYAYVSETTWFATEDDAWLELEDQDFLVCRWFCGEISVDRLKTKVCTVSDEQRALLNAFILGVEVQSVQDTRFKYLPLLPPLMDEQYLLEVEEFKGKWLSFKNVGSKLLIGANLLPDDREHLHEKLREHFSWL